MKKGTMFLSIVPANLLCTLNSLGPDENSYIDFADIRSCYIPFPLEVHSKDVEHWFWLLIKSYPYFAQSYMWDFSFYSPTYSFLCIVLQQGMALSMGDKINLSQKKDKDVK